MIITVKDLFKLASRLVIVPGLLDQPCWVWSASCSRNGYALYKLAGKTQRVHRIIYEDRVGPIPADLQLDHLCRVRNCCNPAHLEPVTHTENRRRAAALITYCPQGHEYTADNTYYNSGKRHCRTCGRLSTSVYKKSKKKVVSPRHAALLEELCHYIRWCHWWRCLSQGYYVQGEAQWKSSIERRLKEYAI